MGPKYVTVIGRGYVGGPIIKHFKNTPGCEVLEIDVNTPARVYKKIGKVAFVCVPTPSLDSGELDSRILDSVIEKIPQETLIVIRSTMPPSYCQKLRAAKRKFVVLPEFLDADKAYEHFAKPDRYVIGSDNHEEARLMVRELPVPKDKYYYMSPEGACLVKLLSNANFFLKNVFANISYDLACSLGLAGEVGTILQAIGADPRIGHTHMNILHKGGRGAGGHCLPKDFRMLRAAAEEQGLQTNAKMLLSMADGYNEVIRKKTGKL